MFEFQCDACLNTASGTTINEAILGLNHSKHCEANKGIPIHYTRVNTTEQQYICDACDKEDHDNCHPKEDGSNCECCYSKAFE